MSGHYAQHDEQPVLNNAARDPEILLCDGAHEYQVVTDPAAFGPGRPRDYYRCARCLGVACGSVGEADPCLEIWHHEPKPHRAASGASWPIGGDRRQQ